MATAKKPAATQAVAVKPNTPTDLVPFDYGDDAGAGMDITMDDLKIPFIALAQSDSKILDDEEATFAPGGAAGMLFNGATLEYADELILALAVRRTTYVEWLPDRGGFVGEHQALSPIVAEAKRNAAKKYDLRTQDGNDLVETRSIYAIILDADLNPVGYCIVPFTGSKMSPWRDYWTAIDTARVSKNAPLFAHTVRLSSKNDRNKKGDKFKNLVMAPARNAAGELTQVTLEADVRGSMLQPDSEAYQAARALRDAVDSGRATADSSTARDGQTGSGEGDEVF
tara:strand:+ start:18668 stop:19516 length:849 start_codon:yes stop_codon:yes gene_type:complete